MSNYWQERIAKSQDLLTRKNIKETEKQLRKYYTRTSDKIIGQFLQTYNHILLRTEKGKMTPADLYNLDKYWKMQAQLKIELERLGDKQIQALNKRFVDQFKIIYESLALDSDTFFEIDMGIAQQMINSIWCADGKSWSQRVWGNTEKLLEALNEDLIDCVVAGRSTRDLKQRLMYEFNVSYNRADSIVKTEMAHIQTQAAQQRYKDYGVQEVEVFVDEDEKTCPICAKHDGERIPVYMQMPVPFHPRCRCCIVPVVSKSAYTGN